MHPPLYQSLACLFAGVVLIVVLTTRFKVHAFFALILSCLLVGLGAGFPLADVITTMKNGFGGVMASLGLIIALGTTLGVLLEHSGSTRVMAGFILKTVGERRAPLAMNLTGFVVGLPIFCDSGFIVLSGLNRTLAEKTRVPLAYMAASLATGLYAVHCLLPPHPGAATAAGVIGISYGPLLIAGIAVAFPAALVGHFWARFATRNTTASPQSTVEENAFVHRPSVLMAFIPVIVPILLIALRSAFNVFRVVGDPVIALLIGVVLASFSGRVWEKKAFITLLQDSVEKAGSILVIIGAGGAFGAILAATRIGDQLSAVLPLANLGIAFPFLLTAALKTAQGSSTVAIITSASIIKPVLAALGLAAGNGPLLCVLSMGAGSMMLSHANDAYFWVIARFTGLDMKTMLRVYTVGTLWMGLTAFATVYLIARCL